MTEFFYFQIYTNLTDYTPKEVTNVPGKNKSSKNMVEVCAKCGAISSQSDNFKCQSCNCEVCVVLPIKMFETMVKAGWAKKKDTK